MGKRRADAIEAFSKDKELVGQQRRKKSAQASLSGSWKVTTIHGDKIWHALPWQSIVVYSSVK